MTRLAAPVTVDDQQIVVDEALDYGRLPYRIVVDNEAMLVTGIDDGVCIVRRAINGSDPEAHASGAEVKRAYLRYSDSPTASGAGEPGPKGDKGDPGPKGDAGSSAYEIAVAAGYSGGQAQWLDSLKGEPGSPGADSTEPGPKGDKGDPGDPASIEAAWPVGSIYINAEVATNPATLLGFGTWAIWGVGKLVLGVAENGTAGVESGSSSHSHTFTQPGAHSDHGALSHSAHAGATVGNHTFTQPTGHSNHVVTQPGNHTFTQPSAHGTISSHAGAAVGVSGAGSAHSHTGPSHTHDYTQVPNHVHVQAVNSATTGGLSGYTPDTSTNTSATSGYSTANPTGGVATGTTVAGGTGTSGNESAHTHAAGAVTQPSDHSALTNNHSGGGVDAHAGGAVDAHSAHSGGAVDAHTVGQANAHSDHAAQSHSAHSGGAVIDGSTTPPSITAYLWKRTA